MAASAQRVTGVVQHYAWGDTEYIPRLLGREPTGHAGDTPSWWRISPKSSARKPSTLALTIWTTLAIQIVAQNLLPLTNK